MLSVSQVSVMMVAQQGVILTLISSNLLTPDLESVQEEAW